MYVCIEHTEEDEAHSIPEVRDFYREHQGEIDPGETNEYNPRRR
jgi:hypothetical protein